MQVRLGKGVIGKKGLCLARSRSKKIGGKRVMEAIMEASTKLKGG